MILLLDLFVALGYLICFIVVLIKQFQNAGPVHGIIGIITCGIWTLVWGWRNSDKLGIRNIMMTWTVLFLICLVVNFVFGPTIAEYFWAS